MDTIVQRESSATWSRSYETLLSKNTSVKKIPLKPFLQNYLNFKLFLGVYFIGLAPVNNVLENLLVNWKEVPVGEGIPAAEWSKALEILDLLSSVDLQKGPLVWTIQSNRSLESQSSKSRKQKNEKNLFFISWESTETWWRTSLQVWLESNPKKNLDDDDDDDDDDGFDTDVDINDHSKVLQPRRRRNRGPSRFFL